MPAQQTWDCALKQEQLHHPSQSHLSWWPFVELPHLRRGQRSRSGACRQQLCSHRRSSRSRVVHCQHPSGRHSIIIHHPKPNARPTILFSNTPSWPMPVLVTTREHIISPQGFRIHVFAALGSCLEEGARGQHCGKEKPLLG